MSSEAKPEIDLPEVPSLQRQDSLSLLTQSVIQLFDSNIKENPHRAYAVSAIHALTEVVKRSNATTMMGLEIELKAAADKLKERNQTSISLAAGCELFSRYVTRTSLEINDFETCKARLIERGTHFAEMTVNSRNKIVEFGDRFIRDDTTILLHGYSSVAISILQYAAEKGKHFEVVVSEGRPATTGGSAAEQLIAHGIPCTLVVDSAIAYKMSDVDLVLVGADGVVESGGIINQIGTYQVALIAHALQTPFYVAAESYKFARLFPLTQSDLPETKESQLLLPVSSDCNFHENLVIDNPRCDYTPPHYITLLFTDLGVLTPSAVSDELIKLYY